MAIIDKPSDIFNTVLYTGNGGTQSITGVNFQPDWVWIKNRTSAEGSGVFDSVRGVTKMLCTQNTDGESTTSNSLTAFGSDGFSVGSLNRVNQSSNQIASWNWKEQAGVFDIVSYTGNGSGRTISHSLGSVPKFMICKDRNNVKNWGTYHVAIGPGSDAGYLNNTVVPEANTNFWNNTNPTSSVFSVGTDNTYNGNGIPYIIYLFGDSSMSKCGSYTGLGGTNYPFIYTGFKPAFVMAKRTNATSNWVIYDNKRQYSLIEGQYNPQRPRLTSNINDAESSFTSDNGVDLVSNGFVVRDNSNDAYTINIAGSNYIYIAFAENPFVTSTDNGSIPACAR